MAESEDEDEFFAKIDLEGICATAEKNETRKRFAEVTQENIDDLLSDFAEPFINSAILVHQQSLTKGLYILIYFHN